MFQTLVERFNAYTRPFQPLWYAVCYLIEVLPKGLSGAFDREFEKFYSTLGPHFGRFEEETEVPRLVGLANGVVAELGPGAGIQFPRFVRDAVTKIYGIEPNEGLYKMLADKARKSGLQEVYVPIHAEVEDDTAHGIEPGTMDTVVCMQVLCSVKDPAVAMKHVHRLLKPGGQFLFWEHEASSDSLTNFAQRAWSYLWTPLVGGCQMSRSIEPAIFAAGPWKVEEFDRGEVSPYSLLPRVWGRLIKQEG